MYFPDNFCNIGNRSFEWVYANKTEFVEHTMVHMRNPTGLFKKWYEYCKMRSERKKKKIKNHRK